jgi:hypothetical protein
MKGVVETCLALAANLADLMSQAAKAAVASMSKALAAPPLLKRPKRMERGNSLLQSQRVWPRL